LLKVVVTDTGIGIPEDKVNDIFEIYTQSSDATARLYGGTGLGLSIVKQLVELQNGTISVSSIHGKGSVFTIEIPYRAGVLTAPVAEDNLQEHYSEVLNGLSILVAEDNLINQKVVLFTLEKHGAKVSIVSNGREAVEQLRHRSFDLVLMDIQMPEMDGYDATRYIRQELKSDIPVIAMTANALKGEAEKCYEAGATGYISKPFDQVVLYNMIAEFTQTKKTNSIGMVSNANDDQLVDFSYIMELSDGRADYIHQVLSIFMENTPAGLKELEQLVREAKDWDAISKKAHFLKSSVGIVKIQGLHERLQEIETLAREQKGMETIDRMLSEILVTFSKAEQIILEKMDAAAQA
jgi:CheY-like chemotaxis protein